MVTCKKKLLFRKISEKKPDLILFDYGLQDESQSMQICSKLKSKEETRNLPLIIFSTNTNIENICMAMGADDFIAKPFEAKELLIKIKNLTSFSGPSVVKCC